MNLTLKVLYSMVARGDADAGKYVVKRLAPMVEAGVRRCLDPRQWTFQVALDFAKDALISPAFQRRVAELKSDQEFEEAATAFGEKSAVATFFTAGSNGDGEALEEIYDLFKESLHKSLSLSLPGRSVDHLVQDKLTALMQPGALARFASFLSLQEVLKFVFNCGRNLALDHLKSAWERYKSPIPAGLLEQLPHSHSNRSSEEVWPTLIEVFDRCLRRLSPEYFKAVTTRIDRDGGFRVRTWRQVAEMLHVDENTLTQRMKRAKEQLVDCIRRHWPPEIDFPRFLNR